MDPLQDYIKSLNPNESNDTQGLFPGAKYVCFKQGKLIGIYTWQLDEFVGDSFQRPFIDKDGKEITEVALPDLWLLLPDKEQKDERSKLSSVLQRLHNAGYSWRFENEVDDSNAGFYLSIIDRTVYPRLWKDNDLDGSFNILVQSDQVLLEKAMSGSEKDWSERWSSNSIDGCLFLAYEWMSNNNI